MAGMTENLSLELREGEPFRNGDSLMEFEKMQYHNSNSEEAKRSNPFDVLYEPHKVHSPSHYNTPLSQSFRYLEMEHNNVINRDQGVNDTSYNNIVTVIDSTDSVNRTGSMISRSATLRNRNRIKTRSKMVRKNDIDSDPEKAKRKSKLAFLFPVRRERSLKQKPKYVPLNRSPKFTNAQEFQQFFDKSNAANVLAEMLPPKMNHFKYKRLFLPDSKLITSNAYYQITRNNSFIINPKTQASKMIISSPIKDTFTKNGVKNEPDLDQHLPPDFGSEAYNKYRISVFSNKLSTIPTFYQLFPEEAKLGMLNASELEQINKKLLFEVLLRRTVAAKIGYRLKHNGYFNRKSNNNASSNGDSSSESHSGPSSDNERFDNQNLPKLSKSHTNSSSYDESINTDELLKQNASLYSGVLPSPQISYSSRIELDCLVSEISDSPNFLPLHKSIDKNNYSSSSVYSTPKTNKFLNNGKFTPMAYFESPESLYIATFRKQINNEGNPSTRRSFPTSTNPHQTILPESHSKFLQPMTQPNEPEVNFLGSPNNSLKSKPKHKSQTSSNTSILQDLEDLSSELSSFAIGHEDMVQNFQYSARDKSLNIPLQKHHNLIQSIEESKDSVGLRSTNSTHPIRSESPVADIKSMRASISIIGTLSDSSSNSSSNKKVSLRDAINAHNLNSIKANISTVALKSISSNKGAKLNNPTI
ncbi:DEHA2A11638p [Debaryomyces hansenii CBS767]|uniref:DEHA2A11638p n=1 Tax=Debaryomyces hansenii (strain ATCC 36239 / CBS 767 / BCRC 21394 / JCM 1990 / NBRC 0083 / IGC 2968) TaxID=284592 RepID=B5RSU9_DEBHA|nr:DEHA2A11638p [Debaryomyces hansenii CBS767]CAR65405.1 DEHA2A11638p [Debaryomyces hansenii CBS767]|eukprot:XP_002770028.1 DEHA2A11638p [Debaryomyces hansenii CBS767]